MEIDARRVAEVGGSYDRSRPARERKRFSRSLPLVLCSLNQPEEERCPISLLPARAAGPCKHCGASLERRLRDDWELAETQGRFWKDVAEQVEEPLLRSPQNGEPVLLSGETEPAKIGLTLLPASLWNAAAVDHLSFATYGRRLGKLRLAAPNFLVAS